jgi:hypothetical protein
LKKSLEEQVLNALELRPQERDLINGFFDGPWQLIKGKFPAEAVDAAEPTDIREYCLTLRRELDEYLLERGVRHQISAAFNDKQVCLTIEGKRTSGAIEPAIHNWGNGQSQSLKRIAERLRQEHSQLAYFEKSLYFYERGRMWFLKPRRRIEWNVRQALLDADDLIAELLAGHD